MTNEPHPYSSTLPARRRSGSATTGKRRGFYSTSPALEPNKLPSIGATRTDRLITLAVSETTDPDTGVCALAGHHGLRLLDIAEELLAYSEKRYASRFGQGNSQQLFGGLLNYQRHFAPDDHWRLVNFDLATATVTWQCHSAELPLVIDSITRSNRLAEANLSPDSRIELAVPEGAVVRSCNITTPEASLLHFTAEKLAVGWCVADDPIKMRELVFPNHNNVMVPGRWEK